MNRSIPSSDPELPETVELPDRAHHIGRDAEGADHYLLPGNSVFVVRHEAAGDELVRVEVLEERSAQEWMDYVRTKRGWAVEKYDDRPFAEWLLEARPPQHPTQKVVA